MTDQLILPAEAIQNSSSPAGATCTAAAGVEKSAPETPFTAGTTIRTMDELRAKVPQLYNQMLLSIAERMKYEQDHVRQRAKARLNEQKNG